MNDFNKRIIEEFRANGGKVGGPFAGAPVLLLTTTGAKSGKQHTTPLMYLADGDRTVVFASMGGAPKNPVWYQNLVQHPDISVTHRGRRMELRARLATPQEKPALWPICDRHYAPYADYRKRTTREIPIFVCLPR